MNISKISLNIVLNDICIHTHVCVCIYIYCIYTYWWKLVGVINIAVKSAFKSTSACAISEILHFKLSPYSECCVLSSG